MRRGWKEVRGRVMVGGKSSQQRRDRSAAADPQAANSLPLRLPRKPSALGVTFADCRRCERSLCHPRSCHKRRFAASPRQPCCSADTTCAPSPMAPTTLEPIPSAHRRRRIRRATEVIPAAAPAVPRFAGLRRSKPKKRGGSSAIERDAATIAPAGGSFGPANREQIADTRGLSSADSGAPRARLERSVAELPARPPRPCVNTVRCCARGSIARSDRRHAGPAAGQRIISCEP